MDSQEGSKPGSEVAAKSAAPETPTAPAANFEVAPTTAPMSGAARAMQQRDGEPVKGLMQEPFTARESITNPGSFLSKLRQAIFGDDKKPEAPTSPTSFVSATDATPPPSTDPSKN